MLHEQDAAKGACFFNQVLQQAPAILREKYQVFRTVAIPLFDGAEHRSICLRHALRMLGATKPSASTLPRAAITKAAATTTSSVA